MVAHSSGVYCTILSRVAGCVTIKMYFVTLRVGSAGSAPMEFRFRLILLTLVGLVAIAVWTFPAWRLYLRQRGENDTFPGLAFELQDDFLALPRAQREKLLDEYERSPSMALEMAQVAIEDDQPAPADDIADQLEGARMVVSGDFQEVDALHWGRGQSDNLSTAG